MKSRLVVLGRVAASLAVLLLVGPQHAWALYRQPTAVTVVDWILAVILVFLPAYIFLKVKFASLVRFRISLLLVLLNVLVWLGAQAYGLYIEKTVEGFAALGPLHRVDSILVLLWQRSIPLSVLVICFLSRRAR